MCSFWRILPCETQAALFGRIEFWWEPLDTFWDDTRQQVQISFSPYPVGFATCHMVEVSFRENPQSILSHRGGKRSSCFMQMPLLTICAVVKTCFSFLDPGALCCLIATRAVSWPVDRQVRSRRHAQLHLHPGHRHIVSYW